MTSKHTPHEAHSVQPNHARPAKSQAPKQTGSSATGQRGDAPENKPDEVVVEHAQRAKEHVDDHQAELAGGEAETAEEDAEHGYSQDSGYAQSGASARKGTSRTERDRKP